jgi:hypothetical protein
MKMRTMSKLIDNGVGYISSSREGIYSKCRYAFYDQVIVKGHDQYSEDYEDNMTDAVYLLFGTAMHKTLELFHKNKCKKRSELISLFRQSYIDYGVDDKEYHGLGIEMCYTYWDYLKNIAPKRILVGTEVVFRVLLGKDKKGKDVYAQGTIDAVFYHGNGIYEIVDYKTSNWLPSTDEFEANTQIALYDIAIRSPELSEYWHNGIEPKGVILTMNYLRYDNGVMHTEIDEETRELNRLYFIDTYTQMNTKKKEFFVCKINNLCPYCDSRDNCPAYQKVVNGDDKYLKELIAETDVDSFAEGIRAVSRYKGMIKILNNAIDEVNEECIEYIKRNDCDVVVDGYKYFLGNSSQRYLLPMITIKILKQAGMWDEKEFISRIPITKVEAMCKDRPDVWESLEHKAVKRSNGYATLKSRKVPKGQLFDERRRK